MTESEESIWLQKGSLNRESVDNCSKIINTVENKISGSQICTLFNPKNDKSLKVPGNPMIYEESKLNYYFLNKLPKFFKFNLL